VGILIVYYDDLEYQDLVVGGLVIGGLVIGNNKVQHERQAEHGTIMALLAGAPLEPQLAVHSTL